MSQNYPNIDYNYKFVDSFGTPYVFGFSSTNLHMWVYIKQIVGYHVCEFRVSELLLPKGRSFWVQLSLSHGSSRAMNILLFFIPNSILIFLGCKGECPCDQLQTQSVCGNGSLYFLRHRGFEFASEFKIAMTATQNILLFQRSTRILFNLAYLGIYRQFSVCK